MRGGPFLSVKENQGHSAEGLLRCLGLLFGEKQPTNAVHVGLINSSPWPEEKSH